MNPMADDQHARWSDYIRALADQLRLRDWDIVLYRDPPGGDTQARITCTYGRRCAAIEIGHSFWTAGAERQRATIVHELLHIYLDDIDTIIRDAADIIGSDAFRLMQQTVVNRIELATDSLADAIAPLFPLPEMEEIGA